MYKKNLQNLATEIVQAKQGISPEIITDLLQVVKKTIQFYK